VWGIGVQTAMRMAIVLTIGLFGILESQPASSQSPYPVSLPGFRLMLREDPHSKLPIGPSCTGVAARTLTCRAFVLTLENSTTWTIYPKNRCGVSDIWINKKEPRAIPDGWWPVSRTTNLWCDPAVPMPGSSRLPPGARLEYSVRLIAPGRAAESLYPGSYTLRAGWNFEGCEPEPCRTSPVAFSHPGDPPDTVPAGAVSNEIQVISPQLPHPGKLKFSFDVAVRPGLPDSPSDKDRCASEAAGSIDCVVFHYKIWNRGHSAARNTTSTCSNSGITPEFRTASNKQWKLVSARGWNCLANVAIEHEILPGKALEGEFLLAHLLPGYDISPLRAPGRYQLRFTFRPSACIASADARFCLMRPDAQPTARSKELTLFVR